MIQLELSYKTSTIGLLQYLDVTNDWMLQLVRVHENSKRSHSIVKESRKFSQELDIENENFKGRNFRGQKVSREEKIAKLRA